MEHISMIFELFDEKWHCFGQRKQKFKDILLCWHVTQSPELKSMKTLEKLLNSLMILSWCVTSSLHFVRFFSSVYKFVGFAIWIKTSIMTCYGRNSNSTTKRIKNRTHISEEDQQQKNKQNNQRFAQSPQLLEKGPFSSNLHWFRFLFHQFMFPYAHHFKFFFQNKKKLKIWSYLVFFGSILWFGLWIGSKIIIVLIMIEKSMQHQIIRCMIRVIYEIKDCFSIENMVFLFLFPSCSNFQQKIIFHVD